MVVFNLLPWRISKRHYQIRKFKTTLLVVIVTTLTLLLSMHFVLKAQEEKVKTHIAKLKKGLKIYNYHPRQSSSIENLNYKKTMKVLFFELSRINSKSVCFTDIARDENKINFYGLTASAYELTEFFNLWDMKNSFTEVQINKIEKQDDGLVQFAFQAHLT